jgi:uncharacterized pyridoxal phosphate-containing UPF0001 family protein
MADLADLPLEWHFIGEIQANKTRQIAEHFRWVHGLDDAHHAERLSRQRPPGLPPLKACLQINLSGEATKNGIPPEEAAALLAACRKLPGLEVVGLMGMPAPAVDEATQRLPFQACASCGTAWPARTAPSGSFPWGCPMTWRPRSRRGRPWCASARPFLGQEPNPRRNLV